MADKTSGFKEMLPKQGMLYTEDIPNMVLCKPKLLPLKSVTLEKLEKMQKEAQETVKEQERVEEAEQAAMWAGVGSQGSGRVDYASFHDE